MDHGTHRHLEHSHAFGQDRRRTGEARTLVVIAITAATMVVEILTGVVSGSMALLADGLHMASHAVALGITAFAYAYARRHAHDRRYSFGTGKVNALGGFTGAVLLAVFAALMAAESTVRLVRPAAIVFNQAILVALLGLVVNGVSVFILGADEGDHPHSHGHHEDNQEASAALHHHHDHNLRAAYLHVMADALTSLLAIVALLAAKYLGLVWMDPLMGIVGALLVGRWSVGLLRTTAGVLLDRQGPDDFQRRLRQGIESGGDSRVVDLHLWAIGPQTYAAAVSVAASCPASPDDYRARIPADMGVAHALIEVHRLPMDFAATDIKKRAKTP
jgi:cation diffusion facilitator family transporter